MSATKSEISSPLDFSPSSSTQSITAIRSVNRTTHLEAFPPTSTAANPAFTASLPSLYPFPYINPFGNNNGISNSHLPYFPFPSSVLPFLSSLPLPYINERKRTKQNAESLPTMVPYLIKPNDSTHRCFLDNTPLNFKSDLVKTLTDCSSPKRAKLSDQLYSNKCQNETCCSEKRELKAKLDELSHRLQLSGKCELSNDIVLKEFAKILQKNSREQQENDVNKNTTQLQENCEQNPLLFPQYINNQLLTNRFKHKLCEPRTKVPDERMLHSLAAETLTANHLKKAKLIFFYQRYPNPSTLRMYFPDVRFNRQNNGQLIKWFSNFREYFYNQIEKYVRELNGNCYNHTSDVILSEDISGSVLFKSLILHYKKCNTFEIPSSFHEVTRAAIQEFNTSISSHLDKNPSWKKQIYNVIKKYDKPIPDSFKEINFCE